MTDDVLVPELNGLRAHRNEMGRSLIFFFPTQWNELLLGLKKKSDTYLSLHSGSAVLPRRKTAIGASWMGFACCLYLLLLYSILLFITNIVMLLLCWGSHR